MQVYRTFLKLTLRNIFSGIMYLVIFTTVAIIISRAQSSSSNATFTVTKVNVGVIDNDNTALSQKLYDYIDNTNTIKELDPDEDKWPDEIFYHNVELIIVINDGFADSISSGNYEDVITTYKQPDSNKAYVVASQINTFLDSLSYYTAAGYSVEDASDKALDTAGLAADTEYLDKNAGDGNASAMSYFFTFMPYMMLCLLINSYGPMLVIWNRPELKSRTEIAALSIGKRNLGLIGATATYSVIVFALFMGVGAAFFSKEFFTARGAMYMLNSLTYLLVCISITYLVAQLSKKTQMLTMWSNVIGLSTSFLCGVFVSRFLLPDKVVSISRCLPTYWYVNITEELKYSFNGITPLMIQSLGIQLLFAVAIYVIGLVIVKSKRQSH